MDRPSSYVPHPVTSSPRPAPPRLSFRAHALLRPRAAETAAGCIYALARISHQLPAADADTLVLRGRAFRLRGVSPRAPRLSAPSSRFDILSSMPAPASGPRGHAGRRLDALATKVGEICGLDKRNPPPFLLIYALDKCELPPFPRQARSRYATPLPPPAPLSFAGSIGLPVRRRVGAGGAGPIGETRTGAFAGPLAPLAPAPFGPFWPCRAGVQPASRRGEPGCRRPPIKG